MLKLLVASALCALVVTATSTKPFLAKTADIPAKYLVDVKGEHSWKMEVRDYSCPKNKGAKHIGASSTCKELAKIRYNASNMDLGWDFVHVETEGPSWYHAGYLEGFVTMNSITNVVPTIPTLNGNLSTWVDAHIAHMVRKADELGSVDPFWATVGKMLSQIQGITDGYNKAASASLTFRQMFLLSFANEVGDVQTHINHANGQYENPFRPSEEVIMSRRAHCSALIKPVDDDLFMAHDTWTSFDQMAYRAYKVYEFGGVVVTMSSYPAQIASGDDWYRTSNDMSIQETTNFVWNTTLFTAVVPETVSEFLRVMTANFLATSGSEWMTYFSRENSGTYNNQYMVVDYKRFDPLESKKEKRFQDGLLWVGEQIPGYVETGDQTGYLREQGYWPSYNIAFYPYINRVSGYPEMEAKLGSLFSYHKYARPEIFKRNESHVKDLSSMMHMMRYNDWKVDPFSLIPNCSGTAFNNTCNPAHSAVLSIASRGDIMPYCNNATEMREHYGPISGPWVAMPCFGAIDSKIASYSTRKTLTGFTVGGPTNDQQPTFSWETSNCNRAAPKNSPPTFDFPWVEWRLY